MAGQSSTSVLAAFAAAHAVDGGVAAAPSPVTNPDGSSTYKSSTTSAAVTLTATLFTEASATSGSNKSGVYQVLLNASPVALDVSVVKAFVAALGYVLGPNVQITGMGVPGPNGTVVAISQSF